MPILLSDPRIRGVAEAERLLAEGKALAAAGTVIRMMPHIEQLEGGSDPLVGRAQRVLAVALARQGGSLRLEHEVPRYARGHWGGQTPADRQRNQDYSVAMLRARASTGDPGSQTELAEALSLRDAGRGEAREILEDLAKRDLVASPDGYAVLAALRARSGDRRGEQAALERCHKLAGKAERCSLAHG
jgi:hypothetical protein